MLKFLSRTKLYDKQLIHEKFDPFQTINALPPFITQEKFMSYFGGHILKPHVNIETGHNKILSDPRAAKYWVSPLVSQTGRFGLLLRNDRGPSPQHVVPPGVLGERRYPSATVEATCPLR